MLRGVLATGLLLAAPTGCTAEFICRDDKGCDLMDGGRCVAGTCEYTGKPTTGDHPTTGASATSDTAAATGVDTDAPAACDEWDFRFPDQPGKATGLARAADGGLFLAGVTADLGAPSELRVKHLSPAGAERWTQKFAVTENANIDDDSDLWARPFLPDPAGDRLLVVYTRRELDAEMKSVKYAPYIHRLAVADGALFPVDDELTRSYHSLRGVVMPDADTLLLAGDRQDNIWYQRATAAGGPWTATWDPIPGSFAPEAGYPNPAITQAIAPLPAGVLVGGSWDEHVGEDRYSGWLRRLASTTGAVACECRLDDVGVMAIAPASDGSVYLAGLTQAAGQSQVWLGKLDPACALDCAAPGQPGSSITWTVEEPGAEQDTYYKRPELFHDVGLAIAALADGDVIVAGVRDRRPWIGRYSPAGARVWEFTGDLPGAALALALAPDERCLTVAGGDDYLDYNHRVWWARQLRLPQ